MDIGEEIITGCKKFRKESQEALYKLCAPGLKVLCMRYCNIKSEAEDILHEGFMKIFVNIRQYKGEGSFEGWMKRVMINTAIVHFHKSLSKPEFHFHLNDDFPEPETEEENNDVKTIIENTEFTREEILETIGRLPNGYRIVFNLYVMDGMKHKDIAQLLGISEGTSKSQLVRARKLLQLKLYESALLKKENQTPGLNG